MKSMHPMLKVVIAVTVLAIVVVVIQSRRGEAEQQAWGHFATARAASDNGPTVESLETARDQVRGSSAEPWVDYQLALKLYDAGGMDNFERARQVAQEALDRNPDHATADLLRNLVEALDTYTAPGGNG